MKINKVSRINIKSKNICILGNGYVPPGLNIDSYDKVIRLNFSPTGGNAGIKTDIVICSGGLWGHETKDTLVSQLRESMKCRDPENEIFVNLEKMCGKEVYLLRPGINYPIYDAVCPNFLNNNNINMYELQTNRQEIFDMISGSELPSPDNLNERGNDEPTLGFTVLVLILLHNDVVPNICGFDVNMGRKYYQRTCNKIFNQGHNSKWERMYLKKLHHAGCIKILDINLKSYNVLRQGIWRRFSSFLKDTVLPAFSTI